MNKVFSDEAWEDFEYWTKQDRKTLQGQVNLLSISENEVKGAYLRVEICGA